MLILYKLLNADKLLEPYNTVQDVNRVQVQKKDTSDEETG